MVNKAVYKTVYESDPLAQVDIAAAWQKHIDQAISRNLYAEESWRDKLGDVYMYAWKEGLKGTYYCFIEKTIKGEKYTQDVNKRGERKGFGASGMNDEKSATSYQLPATAEEQPKRGFGALAAKQTDLSTDEVVYKGMTKAEIEAKLREEKGDDYVDKLKSGEIYAS